MDHIRYLGRSGVHVRAILPPPLRLFISDPPNAMSEGWACVEAAVGARFYFPGCLSREEVYAVSKMCHWPSGVHGGAWGVPWRQTPQLWQLGEKWGFWSKTRICSWSPPICPPTLHMQNHPRQDHSGQTPPCHFSMLTPEGAGAASALMIVVAGLAGGFLGQSSILPIPSPHPEL